MSNDLLLRCLPCLKSLNLVLRNKANEFHQWHGKYKQKISETHSFWRNIFNNGAFWCQTVICNWLYAWYMMQYLWLYCGGRYGRKKPNTSFWGILLVSVMSGEAITKEVLPPLSRISALELCSLATDNPYCLAEFPNSAERKGRAANPTERRLEIRASKILYHIYRFI